MGMSQYEFRYFLRYHRKLGTLGYKAKLLLSPREYHIECPDGQKLVFTEFYVYEPWIVGVLYAHQEKPQD